MDLNKLYKEIEEAEVDLNAKRLKYIKEALLENSGSVKLKFKEFKEFKVPEYTTFKDGEVLSNKDGSYIFILNTHGKYLTSLYASLAARTGLNISDNIAAHENHIECYRLATDSEKQRMIKALKKSENPKAKEYLKRFFGIKEEPKYEFKPFDKVLVRKEGNKNTSINYSIMRNSSNIFI